MQGVGPSVVLVEDDPGMRQAVGRVLMASGLTTASFANAEDALAVDLSGVGIFVLDVHLPGMSGFAMYEKLIARGKRESVIFITAHDNPANRAEAARLGSLAFLTKPFSGRELASLVSEALAQRIS